MIFPLLPFYAERFQATETTVGLLASGFALAQFILSPVWGRLSDKFGRKPIIAIALLGLSLSFFIYGWAGSLLWLFTNFGFHAPFTISAALILATLILVQNFKNPKNG